MGVDVDRVHVNDSGIGADHVNATPSRKGSGECRCLGVVRGEIAMEVRKVWFRRRQVSQSIRFDDIESGNLVSGVVG